MHHGTDALKLLHIIYGNKIFSSQFDTKNQVHIMRERAQYTAKYGIPKFCVFVCFEMAAIFIKLFNFNSWERLLYRVFRPGYFAVRMFWSDMLLLSYMTDIEPHTYPL